ncbi:hypothetical protein Pam2_153 [Pseudanabaena phage Pam2]|nr:hypothetical protein Pam2_153 [Pseudanabaena phage Pam2]
MGDIMSNFNLMQIQSKIKWEGYEWLRSQEGSCIYWKKKGNKHITYSFEANMWCVDDGSEYDTTVCSTPLVEILYQKSLREQWSNQTIITN